MIATKTGPDYDWSETDPMGHEHHWVDDAIPTVDERNRCRRCGHAVKPGYRTEPVHPEPPVLSVSIEARADEGTGFVTSAGTVEHVRGPVRYVMRVETVSGSYFPVEFEITEREAIQASHEYRSGTLDVYATALLKQYGYRP